MKIIRYAIILLLFSGCFGKEESAGAKKTKKTATPNQSSITKAENFRLEIPSSFSMTTDSSNEMLLVVVPHQSVTYSIDNEGIANLCDGEFGRSLCFESAGLVTVTATNSSNISVIKDIEVYGKIDFSVDKSLITTGINNLITFTSIGGIGRVRYSIEGSLGDSIGVIVGNQYHPPTRDALIDYLSDNKNFARISIKAEDEQGNASIKEISIYPSAIINLSQNIPIVCDQRNILSNSSLVIVDGGPPGMYFDGTNDQNLTVTKVSVPSDTNPLTIFKFNSNGVCDDQQTLVATLKKRNGDPIGDVEIQLIPTLGTEIVDTEISNAASSQLIVGEGEVSANDISVNDQGSNSLVINTQGGEAPYRVWISSRADSFNNLPLTSESLKLVVEDGNLSIIDDSNQLYLRNNINDCASIRYLNQESEYEGAFENNISIPTENLTQSEGFYRAVVVDCNGVFREHDFYQKFGARVEISNTYLSEGSPFSNFTVPFNGTVNMEIDLVDASEQVLSNFNNEQYLQYQTLSSDNPAICNYLNCLAYLPRGLFDEVENPIPALASIKLQDNADVEFSFEKYIYPGFRFYSYDRLTGEYLPWQHFTEKEYPEDISIDQVPELGVDYFNDVLNKQQSPHQQDGSIHDFIGGAKDIKVSGGLGLVSMLRNYTFNERYQEYLGESTTGIYIRPDSVDSYPWHESCTPSYHNNLNKSNYFYYLNDNGEKEILDNSEARFFSSAQKPPSFFIHTNTGGRYTYRLSNHSWHTYDLQYNTYGFVDADEIDRKSALDRRIQECFNDDSDQCILWDENIEFRYPESRLVNGSAMDPKYNSYEQLPWYDTTTGIQLLNNYNIGGITRKTRLGAALDKTSNVPNPGIPKDAILSSLSSDYILLNELVDDVNRICIYRNAGFTIQNEIEGWNLSDDSRKLCTNGVNISGGRIFPFVYSFFFYQVTHNSPISKLTLSARGGTISSNAIDSFKDESELSTYKLIGTNGFEVFIETSFSPEDDDSYTCDDTEENTNLLVTNSSGSLDKLFNYVPGDRIEGSTKGLPHSTRYQTVFQKDESCDFGKLKAGILKINLSESEGQFTSLDELLPNDFDEEEVKKYIITDYAKILNNGNEHLYITGVRKDQKSGTEKYANPNMSANTRVITHNYDAPYLIQVDKETLNTVNFKTYPRPEYNYVCHKNTEIENVYLFQAMAKDSYPDGAPYNSISLMMNMKGAYYPLPFRYYNYFSSKRFQIGYLAIDQHFNMDFFFKVRSDRSETKVHRNLFGMSDQQKLYIEEWGSDNDISFKRFETFYFHDFRDR
jgi:hypothetical protein